MQCDHGVGPSGGLFPRRPRPASELVILFRAIAPLAVDIGNAELHEKMEPAQVKDMGIQPRVSGPRDCLQTSLAVMSASRWPRTPPIIFCPQEPRKRTG